LTGDTIASSRDIQSNRRGVSDASKTTKKTIKKRGSITGGKAATSDQSKAQRKTEPNLGPFVGKYNTPHDNERKLERSEGTGNTWTQKERVSFNTKKSSRLPGCSLGGERRPLRELKGTRKGPTELAGGGRTVVRKG